MKHDSKLYCMLVPLTSLMYSTLIALCTRAERYYHVSDISRYF